MTGLRAAESHPLLLCAFQLKLGQHDNLELLALGLGHGKTEQSCLLNYAILHHVIEGIETLFLFYAYNLVVPERRREKVCLDIIHLVGAFIPAA